MSNKYIFAAWIVIALLVSCIFIQKSNFDKVTIILEQKAEVNHVLEHYVVNSFREGMIIDEYQAIDICNAYITDSTIVMFLPFSLCRACFSSLVFSLQDNNFPLQKVTVLTERDNLNIQSDCLPLGIKTIVLEIPNSAVGNIILTRKGPEGQIISMRYNLGDDYIVKLFLNCYGAK